MSQTKFHTTLSDEFKAQFQDPEMVRKHGGRGMLNWQHHGVPTADHTMDRSHQIHDFRLPHGLGISKAFRKPDSMLNHEGPYAFKGKLGQTKNFGRSDKTPDPAFNRKREIEQAQALQRKLGTKHKERPVFSKHEFAWNPIPGANGSHFTHSKEYRPPIPNQQYSEFSYKTRPSRMHKMRQIDATGEHFRPSRTMYHPTKVIEDDKIQRNVMARASRNADVRSAAYKGAGDMPNNFGPPNGVPAPKVWERNLHTVTKPNNDTGDKSFYRRWDPPTGYAGEVHAQTNSDIQQREAVGRTYLQGSDFGKEMEFLNSQNRSLQKQLQKNNQMGSKEIFG